MTCYVYVAGSDGGPWKVGCSSNPVVRLRYVLRDYPGNNLAGRDATIRHAVAFLDRAEALAVERAAHQALAGYRVK